MSTLILPDLPEPAPNVERFQQVLRRQPVEGVPLVELAIAEETLTALHGRPLVPLSRQNGPAQFREAVAQKTGGKVDVRILTPLK